MAQFTDTQICQKRACGDFLSGLTKEWILRVLSITGRRSRRVSSFLLRADVQTSKRTEASSLLGERALQCTIKSL